MRERVLAFLERVKYDTPWGEAMFQVGEGDHGMVPLTIGCHMPDNFCEGKMTTTVDTIYLYTAPDDPERLWLTQIQHALYNRACHEVDERLSLDGELVRDPHAVQ